MSSRVIKFVAGGGKTTFSIDYLKNHRNGLYLAFNNSVVDTIARKGFMARTIDSLFHSYLIPKFISQIPIIAHDPIFNYVETEKLPQMYRGIGSLKIATDGKIYNKSRDTGFSLMMTNEELHKSNKSNSRFIKFIFGKECLRLTNQHRSDLMSYIIWNYPDYVVDMVKSRFDYVIIDEAQDLKDAKEEFGKLLFDNGVELIVLGDDNQNINAGGHWFEELEATETRIESYRCPEGNCMWIRENLGIQIYGNNDSGCIHSVNIADIKKYDNSSRVLLYSGRRGMIKDFVDSWNGHVSTIKSAKGETIKEDVVIIGKTLDLKALYTAITRSTKDVYITSEICDSVSKK